MDDRLKHELMAAQRRNDGLFSLIDVAESTLLTYGDGQTTSEDAVRFMEGCSDDEKETPT